MENFPSSNDTINQPNLNFFSKKFKSFYILLSVFIFVLIFLIFFFFFTTPKNFPVGIIINIKEGLSLRSISKYLEDNKIIRSRPFFETFVIIFGGEKYISSGDYLFEKKLSVFEVARRISRGERHLNPIKVTVPEGFNVPEISNVFSLKLPNFNEENFLILAKEKEGYLFPDTYFFLTTDTEKEVLGSMSNNFEKKITPLRPLIVSSKKTEKEIIIMASLIEEESKGDIDRGIISGILWKRLSINMPLQVDAEPNTYKTTGLPGKPISNPGMKAIEASLNPKTSKYLYYLHDKEGNVHYASNFEEHKLNKLKYLKSK